MPVQNTLRYFLPYWDLTIYKKICCTVCLNKIEANYPWINKNVLYNSGRVTLFFCINLSNIWGLVVVNFSAEKNWGMRTSLAAWEISILPHTNHWKSVLPDPLIANIDSISWNFMRVADLAHSFSSYFRKASSQLQLFWRKVDLTRLRREVFRRGQQHYMEFSFKKIIFTVETKK